MSDVFIDVEDTGIETEEASGTIYSSFGAMAIGEGSKVFRADQSGIWLGAEKFADAPFKVDMEGNLTATSLDIGYVPVGGAAADVNAGATSINPAKISISGATTFTSGYDPTTKVDEVAGTYTSASSGSRVQIFPDANTGMRAYASDGTTVVFNVIVGGTNVGDVILGNYTGGYGIFWDQSAGKLYIKGDIIAGDIDADRISSGTLSTSRIPNLSADKITSGYIDSDRIEADSIGASKLDVATLSAITGNMGTLTAGTISAGTILLNGVNLSGNLGVGGGGVQPDKLIIASTDTSAGSGAYLRFGSSTGSRMWSDSSNRIGINSLGSPMYIYVNSHEKFAIYSTSQVIVRDGIRCDGHFNVQCDDDESDTYNLRVRRGAVWVNTTDSPSEKLYVSGSAKISDNLKSDHHDPNGHKSYNLGGDTKAWDYVYADDFVNKSMGWYDDGVLLQDGKLVSDMEALRQIKPHPRMVNKNGSLELDFSTIPACAFREAIDRDTGEPLPKNKDGDAINPETGEVVGDGVSLTHFVSLLFGALKEVDQRLLNIEKGIK